MKIYKLSTLFGPQWPQIYSILIVCINFLTLGQQLGWTSPYIPVLKEQGVPIELSSYLSIIPSITLIIGSPCVGKLIDWFGRRPALLSSTLCYTINWALTAYGASYTSSASTTDTALYIFFIARVFTGIGDACCYSTIPCYITEIATPRVRGTWGNCMILTLVLGIFLINVMGSYLSIANSAYLSFLLPLTFILNYFFLKESPYYLLIRHRVSEARTALQWLRGTDAASVEAELIQLTLDVQRQQSETGRYVDLIKIPANRRACLVGMLLRYAQASSGIIAFSYFAQTIFIESGSDLSPSMSAIIYSAILFICTFGASFVLDRLGRRKAMVISTSGCCVVLVLQTAFFYIQDETSISLKAFQVFPLVSMVAFVLAYSVGMGLVPMLMMGELFSSSIKSKAFILMNMCYGLSIGIATKAFAVCLDVGLYVAFLFLAVCSAVNILICHYLVPETSGKTLEEIQQGFK